MDEPAAPHDRLPDGTRRTELANERTFLAWLRTGLGALAAGLAIAKLLPTLHEGSSWPYQALGVCFCVLGIGLVWFGVWRLRQIDNALSRGEYAPVSSAAIIVIGGFAGVLAFLTMLVVLFNR
jgi:putative membrane protein